MSKFDDLQDRIEYKATRLVNAQKKGKCAWCGVETLWYDMNARVFLCSEEHTEEYWAELFQELLTKGH